MTRVWAVVLLISVGALADGSVVERGLILDLDADRGVTVEDGERVVRWTNQIASFAARDFVKQDKGRDVPGSGRSLLPRML